MMDDFLDKSEIVGHKIRPTLEGENAIDKLDTLRRAAMDDDDIYPENEAEYTPQESNMLDVEDEEEGEEIESDSDVSEVQDMP